MAKLCEMERQIIRNSPPGSAWVLAQRFGVSWRYVLQLQAGKRGLPVGNGLGARPWKLRKREHAQEWHRRRVAQADAALARALKEIGEGEPFTPTPDEIDRSGLFKGVGVGQRRATKPKAAPAFDSWAPFGGEGKSDNLLYERLPPRQRAG